MNGTARATQYGYSLFEMAVFTTGGTTTPPGGGDLGPNVHVFDPSMSAPRPIQSAGRHGLRRAGDQPVRHPAVRAAVQAGQYNDQRQDRLLHLGDRPRPEPRRRPHRRRRDRRRAAGSAATRPRTSGGPRRTSWYPAVGHRWAVAQAAPFRRIDIHGDLNLAPNGYGWASGGYIADSRVGRLGQPYSQQQWFTRDSNIGGNQNAVWNNVFVGVPGRARAELPEPAVHDDRDDPGDPGEAVPVRRRGRQLQRVRAEPADQHLGRHLAVRADAGDRRCRCRSSTWPSRATARRRSTRRWPRA